MMCFHYDSKIRLNVSKLNHASTKINTFAYLDKIAPYFYYSKFQANVFAKILKLKMFVLSQLRESDFSLDSLSAWEEVVKWHEIKR